MCFHRHSSMVPKRLLSVLGKFSNWIFTVLNMCKLVGWIQQSIHARTIDLAAFPTDACFTSKRARQAISSPSPFSLQPNNLQGIQATFIGSEELWGQWKVNKITTFHHYIADLTHYFSESLLKNFCLGYEAYSATNSVLEIYFLFVSGNNSKCGCLPLKLNYLGSMEGGVKTMSVVSVLAWLILTGFKILMVY